jgi:hypothetical protein
MSRTSRSSDVVCSARRVAVHLDIGHSPYNILWRCPVETSPKISPSAVRSPNNTSRRSEEFGARHQVPILGGLLLGIPQRRYATRDDGDLGDAVGMRA